MIQFRTGLAVHENTQTVTIVIVSYKNSRKTCRCTNALYFFSGSEESGIIVTMMPRLLFWPTAKDLYMIPGTPYDLARNQTLYEDIGEFGIPNHMTTKLILQSCKADYSRKILYMYDKAGSAKIVAMSTVNWRNPSPTKIRQVHTGVSKGNVKVAVDWVSHNIYWTDPLFRWIAMQPGPVNLTDYSQDKSLYKIIIKDDLEQPYALAVDAVGGLSILILFHKNKLIICFFL